MLLASSVYNFYIVKIIPNTDLTKNLNSGKTGEVKMKRFLYWDIRHC